MINILQAQVSLHFIYVWCSRLSVGCTHYILMLYKEIKQYYISSYNTNMYSEQYLQKANTHTYTHTHKCLQCTCVMGGDDPWYWKFLCVYCVCEVGLYTSPSNQDPTMTHYTHDSLYSTTSWGLFCVVWVVWLMSDLSLFPSTLDRKKYTMNSLLILTLIKAYMTYRQTNRSNGWTNIGKDRHTNGPTNKHKAKKQLNTHEGWTQAVEYVQYIKKVMKNTSLIDSEAKADEERWKTQSRNKIHTHTYVRKGGSTH